jgi:iron complex outermembrane receptor protein
MIKAAISTITLISAAFAGTVARAAEQPDPANAEAVAVSGTEASRRPGRTAIAEPSRQVAALGSQPADRIAVSSASPVGVIGAAVLTVPPPPAVVEQPAKIVPLFQAIRKASVDASAPAKPPSSRGLSGDQVPAMINGRRYNRWALVQAYGPDTGLGRGAQSSDMSAIPALAIGSLQVLREGSTAQYGADAIGGVRNYVLRQDQGFELVGRTGQYYAGDGESYQIAANAGIKGDWGFLNLTGEYVDEGQTSRGVTRPSAANFIQDFPALASHLPNAPGPVQFWGNPKSRAIRSVANAAIDVGDTGSLYAFANYARSKFDLSFQYRPSVSSTAIDTDGVVRAQPANAAFNNTFYLTPCPAGNATCPSGGFVQDANTFRFTSMFPAGFTPRLVGETQQLYGVLGYKGTSGNLSYDVSGTMARNTLSLSMYNSASFSYGPTTQTSFEFGDLIQRELNFNADLTYAAELGLATPLTVSAGGEFRKETFEQTVGDPQSYGAGPYSVAQNLYTLAAPGVYAFSGTTAAQAIGTSGYIGTGPAMAGKFSQTVYGSYVGLDAGLTDALTIGASGRYEHFDTVGDALVGKLNGRFKVSDAFSLRASAGTGFRAPSPGQSNHSVVTVAFVTGAGRPSGLFPTDTAIARYFGATDLAPEKSTNYGLGFVATPVKSVTFTVDGYQIDVRNRITISQPLAITATDLAAQPGLQTVGLGGLVQYFTNGFQTRTRGLDVVAAWRARMSGAQLNASLAYSFTDTKVVAHDARVISLAQVIDAENMAPRHRVVFSASWSLDDLSFNVRENYYSSFTNVQDYGQTNGIPHQRFGAKFTTDLELGYTFAKHFTLAVGAQNFTDERPDRLASTATMPIYPLTGGALDGQVYPRSGGPFGLNGGFYYTRLRVKY